MMTRNCIKGIGVAGLLATCLLLSPTPCRAALLQFNYNSSQPLILGVNGNLTYSAGTGNFHSVIDALTYQPAPAPGGFAFFSGNAQVTIDLFVNSNGSFVSNGTGLSVTGALDLNGDGIVDVSGGAANPLLFGSITAFGAGPAGPPTQTYNGLFTIQGGSLTGSIALSGGGTLSGFPAGGPPGGFTLSAENVSGGILGNFQADFSSSNVKADVGVAVPEPSTAVLALAGMTALGVFSYFRRQSGGAV